MFARIPRSWPAVLLVLALIGVLTGFAVNRTPKPAYFTGKAQRGTIHDDVQATGTIDAVTSVQVGSQVSGTVSRLYADFNSRVKQGQVIAQIDPSLFQGALLQAQADLQNARANLAASQAELLKAQATASQTAADYQRTLNLETQGILSQQQLDLAKANAGTAAAAVSAAQAQVKQAVAQVELKAAAVKVAQTNLNYTTIKAPVDGIVVARNVDVGQTVAASLQAPTLFTIAQDLTRMWVYAKTDESDVGNIKPGNDASFTVDAFPREVFHGKVVQVRMNPTTVQNVVTYDTIIEFANPGTKLFPGMTAYVTIPVASAENVLEIPNASLRYKPELKPDAARALYAKYGITQQQPAVTDGVAPQTEVGVVWKLAPDQSLQPVQVRTGITDHSNAQVVAVLAGTLNPGDQLVLGNGGTQTSSTSAPRMSGPGASVGAGPRR